MTSLGLAIASPGRRYALLTFFVLAFLISWSVWVPAALASFGVIPFALNPTLTWAVVAVSVMAPQAQRAPHAA